jgi:hypothetical protein
MFSKCVTWNFVISLAMIRVVLFANDLIQKIGFHGEYVVLGPRLVICLFFGKPGERKNVYTRLFQLGENLLCITTRYVSRGILRTYGKF